MRPERTASTPATPARTAIRSVGPLVVAGALVLASGGAALAAPEHRVGPGESLSTIARDLGTTTETLAEANDLADVDHVQLGQRLTIPGPAALAPSEVGVLLGDVARERGWSPGFVRALAWQESGWQQDVVSSAGAVGIMQVMPETGEFVSRELVGRDLDLTDPHDNVVAGVAFLQHLWELTDGDPEATLAGYYQGLGSVRERGMYDDTVRYVDNVLALRDRFR